MCISVGLLLATYLGTRIYESAKKRIRKPQQRNLSEQTPFIEVSTPPAKNQVAIYNHYTKTSMVSMAFFAGGNLLPILGPLGLIGYIYSAVPYMRDVEKALLKDRKVNVDVLFFLGDLLTLGIGQNFAAAFSLSIMHAGKRGVERAKDHSKKMIADIFQQLPTKVWLIVDDVAVEIPLQDVKANDIIRCKAGRSSPLTVVLKKAWRV